LKPLLTQQQTQTDPSKSLDVKREAMIKLHRVCHKGEVVALKCLQDEFYESNGAFAKMVEVLLEAETILDRFIMKTQPQVPSVVTLNKKEAFLLMTFSFFGLNNDNFTENLCNRQITLCMGNYFIRSCKESAKDPAWWNHVITIERRVLTSPPNWNSSTNKVKGFALETSRTGIEDFRNAYQVNFADPYPGGTLPSQFPDIVQEEILFLIYPEMFVTRLFIDKIYTSESIILSGVTRTNKYTGYQSNFKYDGDFTTDSDLITIIFMDALPGGEHSDESFLRELNKAYIGFSCDTKGAPIATGHWGCGAFGGNHKFKAILQLIAAAEAERDLLYTTFGVNTYTDSLPSFYQFLVDNNVTVGELFKALRGKYVDRPYPLFEAVQQDILGARRSLEVSNPQ